MLRCATSRRAVEIVDIFREPPAVPAIVEEAIAVGAKVIWMQLGVIHGGGAARAGGRSRSGDGPLHEDRARALLRRPLTIGLNSGVLSSARRRR